MSKDELALTKRTRRRIAGRTADLEMKDVFLASDPKVFFTTPHFEGYPGC
ncbi:MAG: hypothetical protein WA304_04985 [Candidatus Cybelea sp.]